MRIRELVLDLATLICSYYDRSQGVHTLMPPHEQVTPVETVWKT